MTYSEYVDECEKVLSTKPRVIIGAQGEPIIAELGKVQPSFLSFLRNYIDAGRR